MRAHRESALGRRCDTYVFDFGTGDTDTCWVTLDGGGSVDSYGFQGLPLPHALHMACLEKRAEYFWHAAAAHEAVRHHGGGSGSSSIDGSDGTLGRAYMRAPVCDTHAVKTFT